MPSQKGLAFRPGVHRTQISLMEGGERLPRFETIVRLVGGLGVEPAELLAGIAWELNVWIEGGLVVEAVEDGEDA